MLKMIARMYNNGDHNDADDDQNVGKTAGGNPLPPNSFEYSIFCGSPALFCAVFLVLCFLSAPPFRIN